MTTLNDKLQKYTDKKKSMVTFYLFSGFFKNNLNKTGCPNTFRTQSKHSRMDATLLKMSLCCVLQVMEYLPYLVYSIPILP